METHAQATVELVRICSSSSLPSWHSSLQDGSSPISRCGVMNPANVPMFHFMMIIPAAGAILFLQGLAQVARCIACLRTGEWPPVLLDVEETEGIFR
jgi:hypothetical protein